MRQLLTAALLTMLAITPAWSACTNLATGLQLQLPNFGDPGDVWAQCIRDDLAVINDASASTSAVAAATNSLQAQIDLLSDATVQLDISTTSLQLQIDVLNVETQQLSVSTATIQSQVDGLQLGHIITSGTLGTFPDRFFLEFNESFIVEDDVSSNTTRVRVATGPVFNTETAFVTNQITDSTEWTGVTGSTQSLTTTTSYIRLQFSCNLSCDNNTACGVAFAWLLDGALPDSITSSTATGIMYVETDNSLAGSAEAISLNHRSESLVDAGQHQVALMWASTGGVDVRLGKSMDKCSLTVREEGDTFGGAINQFSQASQGVTDFGARSNVDIRTLTCSALPCKVWSSTDGGLYVASGTAVNQWIHDRLGVGP